MVLKNILEKYETIILILEKYETILTVELSQITLNLILNKILLRICSFHQLWTENCHKKSII